MSIQGWTFMLSAWTLVTALLVFCFWKMLTLPPQTGEGS